MTRRLTGIAVYSNIFLVMLGLGVVAPNLSDIRESFGVSYGAISWGVSAFAFARLVTNLPAGMAASRLPRVPLLIAGTIAVAAGSLAAALSPNLATFLVARAVSGVGSSISTTVGLTIVLDRATPSTRGRASGTFHSAIGGGAFFGPGFGGLLALSGGWRVALAGSAAAALVSAGLLAALLWLNAEGQEAEGRADRAPVTGRAGLGLTALLASASGAYIAAFAIFFDRGAVQQTIVPLMGRDQFGLSAFALAVALMASAGFTSIAGPFVGALSDRHGRAPVLLPGLALLGVGVALLAVAPGAPAFLLALGIVSVAGTVNSVPSSIIVDSVDAERRGLAIGVYRVVGDLALTAAPIVTGAVANAAGFRVAAASTLPVIVLAVLLAWPAMRQRESAQATVYLSEKRAPT